MAKKITRGITGIKDINKQDFDTNNVNDLLSDGQYSYIHRKKGKSEEYHNLTDNIKTISSDNTDLLTVTNNNKTNNTATLHPKHDAQKEQMLDSTRDTITINHAENATSETTKVDTNPKIVLEHDNLTGNTNYVKIEHETGENTSLIDSSVIEQKFTSVDNELLRKQDKLVGNDFSYFSQIQINHEGDSITVNNQKECNISFTSTLNSQMYKPQETNLSKNDFIIGEFKITSDKKLDSLNIQLATTDGVFHNNIYYNLEAEKEYTLFFNTAKLNTISSQNFYLIFKARNTSQEVTNIKISNFNFYINEYTIGNFNFNTTDFNVSSDNTTPFYDIQNCIEFVKKIVNVEEVPVTINLSNETFEIKMANNLPYAIDKGANKISIIGAGSNLTKIVKSCTATNQGKIIDAGGDCVLKGFTIEYKKDPSYNNQNDYGSNPYCIHLDKSPRNNNKQYTTKVEDVVAINEVNAPIGSGLRHNQKLVYKDVTLVNKTQNGKNGALYVHAPSDSRAANCSFEAYNVFAIMENNGKAVNMENVPGMLEYTNIDCTFYGLGVIEEEAQDYSNFKSTHRITKKSFNNNNNNFNY